MKLEDIILSWDKDCKIDSTSLDVESLKIPELHNKYLKILLTERAIALKNKHNLIKLKRTLSEYYLGEMSKDELVELKRDQFYKKILRSEIDSYIDSDDMYIEASLKNNAQIEKVEYVEAIIKSINNRGFSIKNAIDYLKFTGGQY